MSAPDPRTEVRAGGHTCRARTHGPQVNGVRIDPVTPSEYLEIAGSFLECGRSHVVHFCAAHPTVEARHDPSYRALLNRGELNVPDGVPVAWAARMAGFHVQRLAGTEGLHLVSGWGIDRGVGHFLYGGTPEVLELMQARLRALYPEIRVVGAESPPFRPIPDDELDETVARMREAGADAVWVGLGAPKQELVAARLRERDAAPAIFCVGAAFDFVAGINRRAPAWMRNSGLEWLHRLGSEPRRLWKRYLIGNPQFVMGVVSDRMRARSRAEDRG